MNSSIGQEALWREFDALQRELGRDVQFFIHTKRHKKSQHWRRAYSRAVAAYLEAITAWMARYVVLEYYPSELSEGERRTLEARLSTLQRAFNSLDLFTNVVGAKSPLVQDSTEWQALAAMIRIRNRVTHPKHAEDVYLSDDDLNAIYRAAQVVHNLLAETLERSGQALLDRFRALREAHPLEESVNSDD
jgi:hypothetical protein